MRYDQIPLAPARHPAGIFADLTRDRLGTLERIRAAGELVRGRALGWPLVFVSSPRLAHEVLVERSASFEKSPGLRLVLHPVAGSGLFTSEGDLWRRQRRLMAPIFHPAQVAGYAETMRVAARRVADTWAPGARVDLAHELTRVTMDAVGAALFGVDVFDETDELGHALQVALAWTNRQLGSPRVAMQMLLLDALDAARRALPPAVCGPLHASRPHLEAPFLLSGLRAPALREALEVMDRRVYALVAARRAAAHAQPDLLGRLLAVRDEHGQGMSDRQLRDEALTLFIAGHETTATALAWSFQLLLTHPAALARAEQEALGAHGTDAALPFLTAVFREALRLYPPVIVLPKRTLTATSVGGYELPARTLVFVSPWAVQRDPQAFSEPARFMPERWLAAGDTVSSERAARDQSAARRRAFIPFGAGPRVCIGSGFALLEGPLVLAELLARARFALDTTCPVVPDEYPTLRPRGGLPVRVAPR